MPYRVLIVDDQNMPRQLFESFVAASKNYVLAASLDTASVADIYCAAGEVDLIIMDVVMNDGTSGLEAAARIKASYPSIRIIIVTSMPDSAFLKRAREIGVDSFWYKEVQEAPMLEVMDRTMSGESVYPKKPPGVMLGSLPASELTKQQRSLLRHLIEGLSNREIAEKMFLSPNTVKDYLDDIMERSGIHSRTALVAQASRLGIVVSEADRVKGR